MHFGGVSNRKAFPRTTLLVAAAVPLSIVAVVLLAEAMGHQWNIHGDGVVVMALALVTSVVAFVVELVTLPSALQRLYRVRVERTAANSLSAAVGAGFVIACFIYGTLLVGAIWASGG